MEQIHKHDQAAPDDRAKLRVLLSHWIEHNQEHAASFQEWAGRARELGLEAVAKQIEVAVDRMKACSQALAVALRELGKRAPS